MTTMRAYRARWAGSGVLFWLCAVAVALCAGCGSESSGQNAPAPAPPPVEVKTMTTVRADLPLGYEYMGQTAGSREVQVRARVGGILLKRAFEEGMPIRQGELMFEIDPAPYHAALEQAQGELGQAEARLSRAKRELARMEKLLAGKVVSQKDYDDALTEFEGATAEVKSAQGKVRVAELNLGYTRVDAPITGMTSREARSEGSLVTLAGDGSLLTSILRVDPLYVNFSIPNTLMLRVRRLVEERRVTFGPEGTWVARMVLPDGSEYPHIGRINFTDTQVDPDTGVVRMRASFPNPDNVVLPGQFVRLHLGGGTLQDVLTVPQGAVLRTQQGNMVWTVDQAGVVAPRPVVLGDTLGNDYIVESGLSGGERIIVEGVIKVRPGATVREAASGDPAAQPAAPAKTAGQAAAAAK